MQQALNGVDAPPQSPIMAKSREHFSIAKRQKKRMEVLISCSSKLL
jgi:hypothetical protein